MFRKAEFSAELDAIETEFHRSLRAAIEERETGELTGIVDMPPMTFVPESDVSGGTDL